MGTFENAINRGRGRTTCGRIVKGDSIQSGVMHTSQSGSELDFMWTNGIELAFRITVQSNFFRVMDSGPGNLTFQLWTEEFRCALILKVTTSASREQAEMAHNAVQKIRNTERKEESDQALQSQTSTNLQGQSNHLEVMYHRGMFSITDGARQKDVKVDSFGQEEGVYIWIHDGKLIAGGPKLTEELRKIFGIEEKKKQLMKMMQDKDEAAAYWMQSIQQFLPSWYGGHR
ncbi:hypothetical protein FOPG_18197 [Fusarium oxysporum f. sp. conglutinans race 2 54008]|nr:hypothetical protein FOPG_18197 [Fusarium oxysporum f. sp. conglutinans race 2 54008]